MDAGDSRAILCSSSETVCMSSDHKASRPDEIVRGCGFWYVCAQACLGTLVSLCVKDTCIIFMCLDACRSIDNVFWYSVCVLRSQPTTLHQEFYLRCCRLSLFIRAVVLICNCLLYTRSGSLEKRDISLSFLTNSLLGRFYSAVLYECLTTRDVSLPVIFRYPWCLATRDISLPVMSHYLWCLSRYPWCLATRDVLLTVMSRYPWCLATCDVSLPVMSLSLHVMSCYPWCLATRDLATRDVSLPVMSRYPWCLATRDVSLHVMSPAAIDSLVASCDVCFLGALVCMHANNKWANVHPWTWLTTRVGQNHTFIGIYGVHTVLLAGKSPYIRSFSVQIYASGQAY